MDNSVISDNVAVSAVSYSCPLSVDLKKVALDELREDDSLRTQCLEQFREWIAKHPHIKKCRTDSVFLLRFLRTKKFSVPQSCDMLEKYLTIRQLYPQWFTNLDIEDPALNEIVTSGYIVPLPQRDSKGRRVILSCAGRFDPYKFTSTQMARAHSLVVEALLDDEQSQVSGYTHVNDESGLQMGHLSLWSLTDIKNMLRCIQNSTPMRHKETHLINIPPFANKFMEFAISMLSDKLKKRVMMHKSLDDLKMNIDPSILPLEYGGKVPLADMIEEFKEKCREQRESLLALDNMKIVITDKSILDPEEEGELGSGVSGSFRKLQVD